jgi:peroxiredoxin
MALAYSGLGAEKNVGETLDKFLLLVAGDSQKQAAAYNLKGQAAWHLARQNSDAKKSAEAESDFVHALELQPDMAILHYNLGLVFLSRKDDARGIEHMKLYLEKDPRGASAASARLMIDNPRRARENYAAEFSGTSVDGERISLEDLRGKVVLLDFWATWCGPCAQALPGLKRLVKRTTDEPVVVVSISGDTDVQKWRASVAENQMTWPQLIDARGQIQRVYGVEGIPTYIVIDHEGIIRERAVGYSSWTDRDLQAAINTCLKAAKAGAAEKK